MLSMIKDLPFIDSIFPALIAIGVWCGVHILYIGPEIIAPRLAKKYYLPACHVTVGKVKARLDKIKRAQQEQRKHIIRQKQQRAKDVFGGLLKGYFGKEYFRKYGDHPFIKSITKLPELASSLENQTEDLSNNKSQQGLQLIDYCQCVIRDAFGKRVATGLYSASLRIWKPENIVQLDVLKTQLIRTPNCQTPNFS